MATLLLVPCGFAGGWIWRDVADGLRERGHRVFTPTLTGLGERAHLATPDTDLETHVQDLLGVIECEDLHDVVMVAASAGAMAMTGAAHRMAERMRHLIYVDTLVPADGESWVDLLGERISRPLLDAAERLGDGWRVPIFEHRPPRWRPQPLQTVRQPLRGGNPAVAAIRHSYVHCTRKPDGWFLGLGKVIARQAERAQQLGWHCVDCPTDHLPMLSEPERLTRLLDELAND